MSLPNAAERVPDWLEARRRAGPFLLALDFDGTLAPIVERPEDAAALPAAREALGRLVDRDDTRVAIVSGRALDDVRSRLGLAAAYYAGNHGMEIEGPGVHRVHPEAAAARPALTECVSALERALSGLAGVQIEDKGLTLSVHYRRARDPEAGARVLEAAREMCGSRGLRVSGGKMIVEVRPSVEWDKGRATRFLLDTLAAHGAGPLPAVFIGDDRTDEDAFRELIGRNEAGTVRDAVIVAERPPADTLATCRVDSPREVAELIRRLAEAG